MDAKARQGQGGQAGAGWPGWLAASCVATQPTGFQLTHPQQSVTLETPLNPQTLEMDGWMDQEKCSGYSGK